MLGVTCLRLVPHKQETDEVHTIYRRRDRGQSSVCRAGVRCLRRILCIIVRSTCAGYKHMLDISLWHFITFRQREKVTRLQMPALHRTIPCGTAPGKHILTLVDKV